LAFQAFLNQLRQTLKGKKLAIIVDNSKIHLSKKTKKYLERHPEVRLFYLPPYSPEYNPVELMWKWIKPKVYGFSPIGGLKELERRFRRLIWNYNKNQLVKPINLKLEVYADLL
jgi:transposase